MAHVMAELLLLLCCRLDRRAAALSNVVRFKGRLPGSVEDLEGQPTTHIKACGRTWPQHRAVETHHCGGVVGGQGEEQRTGVQTG